MKLTRVTTHSMFNPVMVKWSFQLSSPEEVYIPLKNKPNFPSPRFVK